MSLLTRASVGFAGFSLALLGLAAPVLRDLVALSLADHTSSHVILVPFVTLGLVLLDRKTVFASVRQAPVLGLAVTLVGGVLLLWGRTSGGADPSRDWLSVSVAGLMLAWLGGFVLCFGLGAVRAALFPLFFALFTVPFPTTVIDGATWALKVGSTESVESLFAMTGTPYLREGFVFTLPGVAIEVADECSGIRSSVGLLLTGLLAGNTLLRHGWARVVILLVILPVAILKNAIRIVALTLLALHVDREYLTGQLHHEGGIVFFLLALGMLAPLLFLLRRSELRLAPRTS